MFSMRFLTSSKASTPSSSAGTVQLFQDNAAGLSLEATRLRGQKACGSSGDGQRGLTRNIQIQPYLANCVGTPLARTARKLKSKVKGRTPSMAKKSMRARAPSYQAS